MGGRCGPSGVRIFFSRVYALRRVHDDPRKIVVSLFCFSYFSWITLFTQPTRTKRCAAERIYFENMYLVCFVEGVDLIHR